MEWLNQLIELVHRLFGSVELEKDNSPDESTRKEKRHFPIKLFLKPPNPFEISSRTIKRKPILLLPPGKLRKECPHK